MQKIYYKETDITQLFTRGKWQHPDTGVKYPANWNPLTIEGVTVTEEPDTAIKKWTPLQFIEQFTDEEQLTVKTLAMSNAQIGLWYDKLLASQEVIATDERLIAGLNALVSAGVFNQSRVDEILGQMHGLPAGTYYIRLATIGNSTATGVYSLFWEERV